MHIAELHNGKTVTKIHGLKEKLKSGNIAKGINCIDSFSFSMLPNNTGFDKIHDFQTLVTVWNVNKNRYDFQGRVLCSAPAMDESGKISKEVTCESFFGFLCDSVQKYVEERNWTPRELLTHIIDCHNSQVEEYKHFTIGEVSDDLDPNNNLYIGIQRENSWKTLEEKLLNKLGCEIRFRVVDGVIYIDCLKKIGAIRNTPIALSRNMKAIRKESDPSAYITRLIPLGAKLTKEVTNEDGTTETVETEERLTIAGVNNGVEYIDDTTAIEAYGIHVGYVEFDGVTSASILLTKARNWLAENNKVQVKYSITALDLSLLGLDIDDFNVHDYHPIINPLLGIDDVARIIKKNIDICEEIRSTIEVGDNFKTLSDIQHEQFKNIGQLSEQIGTTRKELKDYVSSVEKGMNQTIEGIDGLFFYVKYSSFADGHVMTDTPQADTQYIGTCSAKLKQNVAPTDYRKYTWCKIKGETGVGVYSVTNYYLATASSSGITTSTSGWTENIQAVSLDKKYLWNYEKVVYTDNSEVNTEPCIIGVYGDTGNGIDSITEFYALSTSNSVAPTSWGNTVPTLTATNKYLWNYEKIRYTNGKEVTTVPCVIGVYGDKGDKGTGVSTITNYYLASASDSGVTTSTSGWTVTVQDVSLSKKYLWNYEEVHYSDGTKVATAPCIIGTYGETGKGIKSITEYYAVSTSNTTKPTSWSNTAPTLTATNKYLWNYEKVVYTDNSEVNTEPCVIGVYGDRGIQGETGKDGRTQYLHIKYSDDGKTFTANNGETLGAYIGTLADFNELDSTNFNDYTWKKFTEDVDEELGEIKETIEERYTSAINTAEKIILSALESYVQTSNYEQFRKTIETQFEVMAGEIEMNFTTTIESIKNVDGTVQTEFNKLYKYIKMSGDTAITIGSGNSAITLEIDNEKGIIFKKNGVQFGLWDGENFYTGNIVVGVNERAQFGDFAFVPRTDGSLSFLKVGG